MTIIHGMVKEARDMNRREVLRHLSPTIGAKQHFLTVNLTVKFRRRCVIAMRCSYLKVPATIEWE